MNGEVSGACQAAGQGATNVGKMPPLGEIGKATGIEFSIDRLYYANRHQATIWIGKPKTNWLPWNSNKSDNDRPGVRWFSIDELPDDDSLAFAVDVRTVREMG